MIPPTILALFAVAYVFTGCFGDQECTQTRDGCKIDNGKCICGHGCYSDYRFNAKSECQKALRGSGHDICQSNPCRHRGTCSQITLDPGFKCRCEGTGYYGQRCHRPCPKLTVRITSEYPFECIVI